MRAKQHCEFSLSSLFPDRRHILRPGCELVSFGDSVGWRDRKVTKQLDAVCVEEPPKFVGEGIRWERSKDSVKPSSPIIVICYTTPIKHLANHVANSLFGRRRKPVQAEQVNARKRNN
jgi:hypothetical protein